MAHINEDKRKTEGRVALFDIFNDIENCPVSILFLLPFFIFDLKFRKKILKISLKPHFFTMASFMAIYIPQRLQR